MGEPVDKRFHRTLQIESNIHSVWRNGEASKTTPLSANSNSNYMGRSGPTLDDLHNENEFYRANGTSNPENISFKDVNYLSKKDSDDGTECVGSPNSSKCNGVGGKREDQIYVRDVSSQWDSNENYYIKDVVRKQSTNSKLESEKYSDITVVRLECCPNGKRIQNLQLSLGELRRVGVLACNAWTKESSKTPCRLVVPNVQYKGETIPETMSHVPMGENQDEPREDRNNPKNPFIIVEIIANSLDRKRVAEFLNRYIESRSPTTYKCYLKDIKAYGFDHIILIGDCYTGFLFLDCYGRVFEWEDSMGVLLSLGDYSSMASKEFRTRRVMWGVEFDGTIAEFEDTMDDLPNELTFDKPATKTIDVHPVAKKKKNSKKKNSKKKQH